MKVDIEFRWIVLSQQLTRSLPVLPFVWSFAYFIYANVSL